MDETNSFNFSGMRRDLPGYGDDSWPDDEFDSEHDWNYTSTPGLDGQGYSPSTSAYVLDDGRSHGSYPESGPSTQNSSGSSWNQMRASSSRATTIPRHVPGQRHFAEQFSAQTRPLNGPLLPCEFNELVGCVASFPPDETVEWIEHASAHLNFIFPWECSCWFCDDIHFNANDTGGYASDNFHSRMHHIRDHIVTGEYRVHERRRDYFLLKHLNENHLIPPQVARRELSTFEGPGVPGEGSSRQHPNNRGAPRQGGEAYDQAAEDRQRRREHRDKGKSKKHGRK